MKNKHGLGSSAEEEPASPSRPIRVLRVIARLNIGGPARHVSLVSKGLDARGYRHLLVKGAESGTEGSLRELASGVEVSDLPRLGREISPINDFLCLGKLIRIIREFRPDILHTHTAKAGFVGRLAAILGGVPVIVHTFHGHVLRGYFPAWKNSLFRFFEKVLAKRTNLLITVSQKVALELAEEGVAPASRFQVVPLGLHLDPFLIVEPHSGLKKELGLSTRSQLIGAVGRLVPIKDLDTLLQALALLQADLPDLHLALVGDGESRQPLSATIRKLGLSACIHFMGWRHDLPHIYGGLDMVVLSSRNEGTPVSLIEALAAGRPVVATQVGGVPEVLQGGKLGRLVPPGNPTEMAQAIRAELAHTRGLPWSLRVELVERYSPKRLVEQMDQLYRQALARRRVSGLTTLR